MSLPETVLYCRCAYAQVLPAQAKQEMLEKLYASGQPFQAVADLCEMAAHRDERLGALAALDHLHIVACHERAVKGLFQQAQMPLKPCAKIVNLRQLTAVEAYQKLEDSAAEN
jgi:hypothetical protein